MGRSSAAGADRPCCRPKLLRPPTSLRPRSNRRGMRPTSFRSEATAEEPMVCGLSAGGNRIRTIGPALVKGLSAVADERCQADKLDGVIKHRSSRETTMVGRGPLSTVVSFSARPKVRIHSPPAKSLQTFCSAWRLQELARTLARRREGRSARRRAVGLGLPLVSFAQLGG